MNLNRYLLAFLLLLSGCSKKGSEGTGNNYSPAVTLSAEIIQVNPFTFIFTATATHQNIDPLSFKWVLAKARLKTGTTH
jgi:hypothetical protein